jgi:hypothetical protein
VHLKDGKDVCRTHGKVAFGTRAWEVFQKLDQIRDGAPVNAYIYASHDPASERLEISWLGRYVHYQPTTNGRHPNPQFRPPSTREEDKVFDIKTSWVGFWELDQLEILPDHERLVTGSFIGYDTGKQYKKNFVPEGPTLIVQP